MATVRIEHASEELADNWIEFSANWTLADLRQAYNEQGEGFIAFWRSKAVACHVRTAEGEIITDPMQIHERIDELDLRLVRWVPLALLEAGNYLVRLGELSALVSSNGVGASAARTRTPTTAM